MHNTFPAFQLLLVLSFSLIFGLPLMIWLFMRGNRDRGAHLWFMAVATNATALALVGFMGRFSAASAVLFLLAALLAIESLRGELGRPPVNWRLATPTFLAYTAFQFFLEYLGLRMSVGYILNLFLINFADIVLIVTLLKVHRIHRSRGLLMVTVGVSIVVAPNLYRLAVAVLEGGGPDILSGSATTTAAMALASLISALNVVGYGGFVMEKLHRRQLEAKLSEGQATERQKLAEQHAQAMEALVRQRDDMILLNSRFSTLNSLALYNSAIVHEISQPLQALMSILDGMSLRAQKQGSEQDANVVNAMAVVQKMSGTLSTLRTLIGGRQPVLETLRIESVLNEITPILLTQARRQGVALECRAEEAPGAMVKVNRVLLQRVIFNLVTNAFEALADDAETRAETRADAEQHAARLTLTTETVQEQGLLYNVLRVQDNGPGLPANLTLQPGLVLRTSKEQGVGVGLTFTQMIVESWRGQLRACNRPPAEGGGAVIEVWIPAFAQT